jgi:hypothetical protein
MCEIKRVKKKLAGRNYVPSVIEPSFGIGRILYCIFEHSYYTREVRYPVWSRKIFSEVDFGVCTGCVSVVVDSIVVRVYGFGYVAPVCGLVSRVLCSGPRPSLHCFQVPLLSLNLSCIRNGCLACWRRAG